MRILLEIPEIYAQSSGFLIVVSEDSYLTYGEGIFFKYLAKGVAGKAQNFESNDIGLNHS